MSILGGGGSLILFNKQIFSKNPFTLIFSLHIHFGSCFSVFQWAFLSKMGSLFMEHGSEVIDRETRSTCFLMPKKHELLSPQSIVQKEKYILRFKGRSPHHLLSIRPSSYLPIIQSDFDGNDSRKRSREQKKQAEKIMSKKRERRRNVCHLLDPRWNRLFLIIISVRLFSLPVDKSLCK